MKDTIKKIITVVLTLAVLCSLMAAASVYITPMHPGGVSSVTASMWNAFYQEPENTVDVFFVGPSTVWNGVLPTEMYDRYGFTSYDLSSPYQTMVFSEQYIREGLKTQTPSLIVVDSTVFLQPRLKETHEPRTRIGMDNVRFSWDKLKTIYYIITHSQNQSFLSYIFPLLRYHSLWQDLVNDGYDVFLKEHEESYYSKGAETTSRATAQPYGPVYTGKTDEINQNFEPDGLSAFKRIAKLCKEKNIQLLAIRMPVLSDRVHTYAMYNGLDNLCRELAVPYLDLNLEEHWNAMELDTKTCFQNKTHLNVESSDRATAYLADYLHSHYDLPDHRADSRYHSWNEAIQYSRSETLERIASAAEKGTLSSMLRAIRISDTDNEIIWPVNSYLPNAVLYRELPGEPRELLTDSANGYYVDTDAPEDALYTISYSVRGSDTPFEIRTSPLLPYQIKVKGPEKISISAKLYYGLSDFSLFRVESDNSMTCISGSNFTEGKACSDSIQANSENRYVLQFTDRKGTERTIHFTVN